MGAGVLSYFHNDHIDRSGYNGRLKAADYSLQNQTLFIKDRDYTLVKRLGGGAFGSVWAAATPDGQSAAVKVIDISRRARGSFNPSELIDSFNKEVTMAYRMREQTQHVVTIFGFDFDPRRGLALLAMELGGDTLTKRIAKLHMRKNMTRRHRRFDGRPGIGGDYISPYERKNIWVPLFNIIQTLHKYHVVHRDLKPDNLVFFGPIMKIVDLGIAQKEIRGLDPSSAGIGTPYFSAPECFEPDAHVTTKADVWSAGAILYNMTYGTVPTQGSYPPDGSPPTRSASVIDIIDNCLQEDAHRRSSHKWLARHPYTTNPSVL